MTQNDYFGEVDFLTVVAEKIMSGERPGIPSDLPIQIINLIQTGWVIIFCIFYLLVVVK